MIKNKPLLVSILSEGGVTGGNLPISPVGRIGDVLFEGLISNLKFSFWRDKTALKARCFLIIILFFAWLSPLDSVTESQVRSYSLDSIFNFTFSFPEISLIVNAVAVQLQRFDRIAISVHSALYYLTTPLLQTAGRSTERCLNVSTKLKRKFTFNFISNLVFRSC